MLAVTFAAAVAFSIQLQALSRHEYPHHNLDRTHSHEGFLSLLALLLAANPLVSVYTCLGNMGSCQVFSHVGLPACTTSSSSPSTFASASCPDLECALQASAGLLLPTDPITSQATGKAVAVAFDDSLGEEGWEACPFNTPLQGFRWRGINAAKLLGEGGTAQVFL